MNFFEQLNEFLIRQINSKISQKQKGELRDVHEYGNFRSNIEENLVLSTNWCLIFDNQFIEFPTQNDAATVKNLSDDDLMRNIVILNHALCRYIDHFEESKDKTKIIHAYYRLLKQEVTHRPSLDFYTAQGDGFKEYLENRAERLATVKQLEMTREQGNICPNCKSTTDIKSNGNMWHCSNCGYNWRKRH